MQMSLTEANKQCPFWTCSYSSFLLATAIPVSAESWQREQGQLQLGEEPLPWNWWVGERWRMHPFSAHTEDTFTPAGSRPGLPSPIYRAGCLGWINSNEIILFIINAVLPPAQQWHINTTLAVTFPGDQGTPSALVSAFWCVFLPVASDVSLGVSLSAAVCQAFTPWSSYQCSVW